MQNDVTDAVSEDPVIPPDNPDPIEAEPVQGDAVDAQELVQSDELIPDDQPDPIDGTPSASEQSSR